MPRQTWEETWARVAKDVSGRSRCSRAKIGAVIVSAEERVVATGYNGPPAHWEPVGVNVGDDCITFCARGQGVPTPVGYDDCPSNHAEINALMHCSRGERRGGTIYVTGSVCYACAKAIANSGLKRVCLVNVDPEADAHRHPERTLALFGDCGMDVVSIYGDDRFVPDELPAFKEASSFDPGPCPRCGQKNFEVNMVDVNAENGQILYIPGSVTCLTPGCPQDYA